MGASSASALAASAGSFGAASLLSLPMKGKRGGEDVFGFLEGMTEELRQEGRENRVRALERFERNLKKMVSETQLAEARMGERSLRESKMNVMGMAGDEVRLPFSEIGSDFAGLYLEWLQERGMAESTCAAELGVLRTVLKRAVEEGLLTEMPEMPKGVYYKPVPKREGEFPEREVFERLAELTLDDVRLALTRDMLLFAYYCGGLELVDVVGLTPANVTGNLLRYTRRSKGKEYSVRFDGKAAAIAGRYLFRGGDELFPVSRGKRATSFDSVRRLMDKRLKKLGEMVGFPRLNFSMNIAASLAQIPRTECGGVVSVWDRFLIMHNS